MDAGGKLVKAHNAFVNEVVLSTSIEDEGVKISTVEHLMSAFSALGVDNILVELDSFEVPIMDGSSAPLFCSLIPADCTKKTNGADEPSIIGTSNESNSTNILSTPSAESVAL
jgi:UDP-3-O-acyl-N-acetylglucosamine deacetylase